MLEPSYTSQFEKDLIKMGGRGKSLEKLKKIISNLVDEIPLDAKNKDHKLIGSYKDLRECHIEPNWLLIYKITGQEIIFERTGTHSDLFK